MVKKIIIDEIREDGERPSRNKNHHRPFPEFEGPHRGHREEFKKPPRRHGPKIVETKLFTSKELLVEYVNEKGQGDALIDIFKIEEGLYKMVIKK